MKEIVEYPQDGATRKAEIELDELGILVNGMNEQHLKLYSTLARNLLSKYQNELITYGADKELPITVVTYPAYGRISSALERSLSRHRVYEVVPSINTRSEQKDTYIDVSTALQRSEISNIILTGTDLFLLELLKSQSLHSIEVLTSPKLISFLPDNSSYAKWVKNNTIYLPDETLIELIYKKE